MATNIKKDDTFKLRIDNMTYCLLERARSYVDLNKSEFIRQSIREKAEAVIAEHEKTRFTADDWRMFFEMIDNPQEPTFRMKKAAQKFKEITTPDEV